MSDAGTTTARNTTRHTWPQRIVARADGDCGQITSLACPAFSGWMLREERKNCDACGLCAMG